MCSIILLVALTQALFGLAEDGRRWAWNPYSQSVSTHDNFTISKLSIIGSQSSSDDTPAQILTSPSQTIGTKEANLSSIPQALLVLSDRDDGDLWAWNPYSPGANYSVPKTIISSGSSSDEAPQILTPSTCTQKSDLKNLEGRSSSTPLPPLGSPQSLISNPSPQRGLYGSFNSMPPALLTPVHSCAKSPISPQILPLASPSRARLIGKPLYVGKPVVPSWAALPMDEYVRLIPQTIIRKFKSKRINATQNVPKESELVIISEMFNLWQYIQRSKSGLKQKLSKFWIIMFDETRPHVDIQSYYIVLWSNVDIIYTMNYILSAFCTGMNENAVVVFLKQLSVVSGGRSGEYLAVIKAIWDALLLHTEIEKAVLHDSSRNVASFSLMTLAVFDDSLNTTMKLVHDAMIADQKITLATYNCVLRRLSKSNASEVTAEHMIAIEKIWGRTINILKSVDSARRQNWYELMLTVCVRFRMTRMAMTVQMIGQRDLGQQITVLFN